MKKLQYFSLFAISCSMLFSQACRKKDSADQSHGVFLKSIKSTTESDPEPNGLMWMYDYNAENKLTKVRMLDHGADDSVIAITNLDYNSGGSVSKVSSYINGELVIYYDYQYNAVGQLTNVDVYLVNGIKANAWQEAFSNPIAAYHPGWLNQSERASDGTPFSHIHFEYTDKKIIVREGSSEGDSTYKKEYFLDDKGNDIQTVYYRYENGYQKHSESYKTFDDHKNPFTVLPYISYPNSNNNMLRELYYTKDEDSLVHIDTIDYNYKYDADGYVISAKEVRNGHTYSSIRLFEYIKK